MRARSYRPIFDRLDTRLVLDSGASVIAGANVGSSVIAIVSSSTSTDTDVTTIVDWTLSGSPSIDATSSTVPLVAASD
jgi:hypothetical protein